MPCTTKLERMQQKNTSTAARVPTVPTVLDSCTDGWLTTDIYFGEFFVNFNDSRLFTRVTAGIREMPWMADLSGNLFNSLDLSLGTNTFNLDRGLFSTKVQNAYDFGGNGPIFDVAIEVFDDLTTQIVAGVQQAGGIHSGNVTSYNRTTEIEIGLTVQPDVMGEFVNIHYDDQSLGTVLTEHTADRAGALSQFDDGTVTSFNLVNASAALMSYVNVNSNNLQISDTGLGLNFNASTVFNVLTAGDIRTNQSVANVNAIPANSFRAIEFQTIGGVSMFVPAFAALW